MAYPQKLFSQTKIHPDSLIGRRRQAVSSNTLLYQLKVLKSTGRYDAFRLQWHQSYSDPPMVWPIPNHLFWDSDVAKWIEGACYFLKQEPNEEVNDAIGELVEMIRNAQQPDGYLNIHFTVVEPGKRFTNLRDFHELYNAGHLIEAALAHHDLYQNNLLLDPILKYVDLLCDTFGHGKTQIPGYPGHPEIELALLRLYDCTGNPKHFELARFFLLERGNPSGMYGRHYFDVEAERRNDDPNKRPAFYPERKCHWYHQAHAPIIEQSSVEGHSVRAMYLLSACADLIRVDRQSGDEKLRAAVYRLWDNMIQRKMYVTGGIGAMKQWEGFGLEYFLPQGTDEGGCYSETCASIGVMMLAERLLKIDLDGRFADVMELCLYNAVLTSMSHDGKRFTYVNQLASSDKDPSKREEWFTCACCPPNVLRLLGQIGGYIYQTEVIGEEASIIVHLYVSSTVQFNIRGAHVELNQESDWPWQSDIRFTLKTSGQVAIKLRIPGWTKAYEIFPQCPTSKLCKGYLELPGHWISSHPEFTLSIALEPRLIASHPKTYQNTLSLARGPIVYCVEDFDNAWVEDHFKTVQIDLTCKITERSVTEEESGDQFVALTVKGASVLQPESIENTPHIEATILQRLLRNAKPVENLHFIPYYFRANRGGRGQMRVGLMNAGWVASGGAGGIIKEERV